MPAPNGPGMQYVYGISLSHIHRFQMRITGTVTVLVVYDNGVAQFVLLSGKNHGACSRRKYGVPGLRRYVYAGVIFIFGKFLAFDTHHGQNAGQVFQLDFFGHGLPAMQPFVIHLDFFHGRVGELILVDNAVDFSGIVFQEGLENILYAFFQYPERIQAREHFLVVVVLLDKLGVGDPHLFVVCHNAVDFTEVVNEYTKDKDEYHEEQLDGSEPPGAHLELFHLFGMFRYYLYGIILSLHDKSLVVFHQLLNAGQVFHGIIVNYDGTLGLGCRTWVDCHLGTEVVF